MRARADGALRPKKFSEAKIDVIYDNFFRNLLEGKIDELFE